jgi:hypothetical protein
MQRQAIIHITPADPGIVYRVARSRPFRDNFHKIGAAFIHRVGA